MGTKRTKRVIVVLTGLSAAVLALVCLAMAYATNLALWVRITLPIVVAVLEVMSAMIVWRLYRERCQREARMLALCNAVLTVNTGKLEARCLDPEARNDEIGRAIQAFNGIADSLQRSENSLSSFISNVAHELRTPLTSICGFADCMLDGVVGVEEYPRCLRIISQEGKRLARVVRNMLSVTRLEEQRYVLTPAMLDLGAICRDVLGVNEQRIADKNVRVDIPPASGILAYADIDAVQQVVSNIVDNALKFIDDGGLLTFRLSQEDGMAQLAITNTGEGIDHEKLRYVFDRFYKADTSRALKTSSSGLGLFICKLLIKASGGDISATSEEGKSCTFTFTLPQNPPDIPL